MLVLLRRLANELAGSTDARSWSVRLGLAGGLTLEPVRIDLEHLPTVIVQEKRSTTYTTLRDIVHVQLSKSNTPALETALAPNRHLDEASVTE